MKLTVEAEELGVALRPDSAEDAGRALDVGEQECHRAARQIVHPPKDTRPDAVVVRTRRAPHRVVDPSSPL